MVELQNLCSLLNVIQYGSLSEAARFEEISQPAMSKRIKSVTTGFNTTIFYNNYSSLTEEGQIISRGASKIKYIYSTMENELKSVTRNIRIGVSYDSPLGILYDNISRFIEFNPNSQIQVYSNSNSEILGQLSKHLIDLAVISDEAYRNLHSVNYIEVAPLAVEQIGLIVPSGMPTVRHACVRLEDELKYYPLVVPNNQHSIQLINKWLGDIKIKSVLCKTSSNEELIQSVRKGIGYAFAPLSIGKLLGNTLSILPTIPKIECKARIIVSAGNQLTSTVIDFIDLFSDKRKVF